MAREIVMLRPLRYDSLLSDYSEWAKTLPFLERTIQERGLTPGQLRKIAILCAGVAAEAKPFVTAGWRPADITCFDWIDPVEEARIEGMNWHFWDLQGLNRALRDEDKLPPEVETHREQYDILLSCWSGIMCTGDDFSRMVGFFLHPGGIVVTEQLCLPRDSYVGE